MVAQPDEGSPSARLRAAVDGIISDTLQRDPDQVARTLEEVVKRCKAEARYAEDEIDAAAARLRSELGIPFEAH